MNPSKLRQQQSELPIWQVIDELQQALSRHTRVVLSAPPGAGKSSIVPLAMLGQAWLGDQKILILEPRRLAARSLAWRMAELSGQDLGELVGLRTRDENRVSSRTRIEVLTEALLTRRLQSDPELADVGLVIFDEFHERSLHADLGLALARDSQAELREDLRLLVMSATLDEQALPDLLQAPLIQAQGRSYAVEIHYRPLGRERLESGVAREVRRALRQYQGDLLVFLPGEGEIRRVAKSLGELGQDTDVHPLYGRLERKAQQAAISPAQPGRRKLVLATSIAESSVTIDGVTVVIDAGLARQSIYDPKAGFAHMQTRRVSQDAADQRAGRAGRTAPGTCIRLWSSDEALRPQRQAEIELADLASLALNQAAWGSELNWLQEPPAGPWAQAWEVLEQLQLVDSHHRLSALGRRAIALGNEPRTTRILLQAKTEDEKAMACDLAALLEFDGRALKDTDIHRLWLAWRHGGMAAPDKAALQRETRRWRRRLGCGEHIAELDPAPLLAAAYADRIALLREGTGEHYLLANGRGARLDGEDALHGCAMLIVCDLDGRENARIRLAAELKPEVFEATFGDQLKWCQQLNFDIRKRQVNISEQRRFGALVLAQRANGDADPEAVQQCLLGGIRQMGLGSLDWSTAARQLRARLAMFNASPEPDQELLDGLEQWLGPYLLGCKRLDQISPKMLMEALMSRLDYPQQQAFQKQCPAQITLPNGREYKLDYLAEDGPVLAVRLQDVYGLDETPQVAGRPVLLHLLSPARRPQAVTRDLHSFWRNAWPDVRKQMRGRYPKHNWPEQPWLTY